MATTCLTPTDGLAAKSPEAEGILNGSRSESANSGSIGSIIYCSIYVKE